MARRNTAPKGRTPFDDFTVGSKPMSKIVKAHDPPGATSQSVFGHIKANLEDWVEEAIAIRSDHRRPSQ